MSLSSASSLKDQILALSPSNDKNQAITNFVTVIANFTNQVQAGSTGSVGILTFGNSAMVAKLLTQGNVSDSSWISNMADAWEQAINTSILVPGTVTDPSWTGSGGIDTISPSIINVASAKSILTSALSSVVPDSNAPLPIAEAFRNAALGLNFLCTGLGPPPTFIPIPLTFSAQ